MKIIDRNLKKIRIKSIETFIGVVGTFVAVFLTLGQIIIIGENNCENDIYILYNERDSRRFEFNGQFNQMMLIRVAQIIALSQNETAQASQHDKDAIRYWDYMSQSNEEIAKLNQNISFTYNRCKEYTINSVLVHSIAIIGLYIVIILYYILGYRRRL